MNEAVTCPIGSNNTGKPKLMCALPLLTSFTHEPPSELHRQLKASEDHCQQLTEDKSRLESQLSQLTELSGDSSQQLSFLTEQLNEKER